MLWRTQNTCKQLPLNSTILYESVQDMTLVRIMTRFYFIIFKQTETLNFLDPTKGERDQLKTDDDKDLYDYLLDLTPRLLYEMSVYGTACKFFFTSKMTRYSKVYK